VQPPRRNLKRDTPNRLPGRQQRSRQAVVHIEFATLLARFTRAHSDLLLIVFVTAAKCSDPPVLCYPP